VSLRRPLLPLVAAAVLAAPAHATETRAVTDSAGRRVEVPVRIARVFAAGPPASVLVFVLNPDTLLGWTSALRPAERPFIPARYADLPTLGRLAGRGGTANVESVLAMRPDVVLDYGAVGPTYVSLADRGQRQTGLPYLLFDGSLGAIPRTLETVGTLLGVPDRGRELARYAARVLAETDERVARVPPERRPRVYYARGPRGLETGLQGSINVESLERLGARNVAAAAGPGAGVTAVSLEQVLAWDPEVVVTLDPAVAQSIATDPGWQAVRAVREGRVHVAPSLPFGWIDFPPSVNRLIGLVWLGGVLYPDLFPGDVRREARDFYGRFYQQTPDDKLLDALLGGVVRSGR
jgi:iron complex transport system substrate-binding protein